jgi:ubiquinone/menaquinone biosynthesis C-methylase UbiE
VKCQIALRRQRGLSLTAWRDLFARARVARLACEHGGRALDVGTGACACMARILARCHLRVTAIDSAAVAVHFAENFAATRALSRWLEVRREDAAHMPFADGSYGLVLAFDSLGHSTKPERVLTEMFRVCAQDGLVLITEHNRRGREATRHLNFEFETRLKKMLRQHCLPCRRIDQPHHITFVCPKKQERRR